MIVVTFDNPKIHNIPKSTKHIIDSNDNKKVDSVYQTDKLTDENKNYVKLLKGGGFLKID